MQSTSSGTKASHPPKAPCLIQSHLWLCVTFLVVTKRNRQDPHKGTEITWMPHDDPKGPSTVKSCINPFMCHSLHIPHGTFGEQANTRVHKHTRAYARWGLLTRWERPSAPLCACWRWWSQTVSVWQRRNTQKERVSNWTMRSLLGFRAGQYVHHTHTHPTHYDLAHALHH